MSQLVKLEKKYEKIFIDMMDEWSEYNNSNLDANSSPSAIFKNDYHDFDNYLKLLYEPNKNPNFVPSTIYFLYDEKNNSFLGAIDIRHSLNEYLLKYGGNLGVGIRPSKRKQGYGTLIIHLALEKCKELGIDNVLITCNENNQGSYKAILNNGGILENIIYNEIDKEYIKRLWIKL